MSLGASGSVAKTITFASWKGRSYVRRLVIPANPRSAAQVASRAIIAFLSQAWKNISALNQATWQTRADAMKVSPFNAYTSTNQKGMSQFPANTSAPSKMDNPARTGTQDTLTGFGGTGGKGQVVVQGTITTKASGWGIIVEASTASGPPDTRSSIIFIIDTTANISGSTAIATITGLAPGVYNLAYAMFTDDGNLQAQQTAGSFTVT